MAEFANFLEAELLDHAFGEGARTFTASTGLHLALITAVAADTNTGTTITEPSTGGYARKAITFGAATGTNPTQTSNTATITFTNTAATAWTVVGIAIVGALTLGDLYCYDNDMTDATINQNEKIQFQIGDIDISLD
jgi:hypothetical protein